MPRYLTPYILHDLAKKMVFLGGPRQCGKTTLAKRLIKDHFGSKHSAYFTWDFDDDRRAILKHQWDDNNRLLVFDELHKFPRWKTWLKGIYDTMGDRHQILVTGSARLDVYRRGGDSLLGRYHHWRLHPFTLSEFPAKLSLEDAFHRLMTVGGFPEPFLDGDEREARRWRRDRFERILREDVRDLESLRDISTLGLMVDGLRSRVGGLIVLSNLAEDLQISPQTAKRWLDVLERMYLVFVVKPYTKRLPRAILKPPKVYFYDNGDVIGDEGMRFENLVATSLLKRIQFLEDRDGYRYELRYVRDKEGREVDFVIVKDDKVIELVEAKYSDTAISTSLQYYAEKLKPDRVTQIVAQIKRPYQQGQIKVQSPLEALRHLEDIL